MSDTSVNITKLPEATEITTSDYLLLENASGTQILKFNNFVVTEYNTTFRHLLSGHTTDIANNTTNITSLSTTKAWKETASTSVVSTMSSVGIGTTTPGALLNLDGVNSGAELRLGRSNDVSATSEMGTIKFHAPNASSTDRAWSQLRTVVIDATNASEDARLAFNVIGGGSLTEKMCIQGDGNVGIGTTAPGTILDIAGTSPIIRATSDTTGPAKLYLLDSAGSGNPAVVGSEGLGMFFQNNGNRTMTFTASNNVGIGTTAPETKLHLNPSSGSHAAITLGESSTTPDTPSVGDECRIYMKGDKLIVQFNDSGIIRYKYMDLTGSTDPEIWTNTTTAP